LVVWHAANVLNHRFKNDIHAWMMRIAVSNAIAQGVFCAGFTLPVADSLRSWQE
jgi:hypothetical protein